MVLFNDRSLIVAKVLFIAALFLLVSSCEGAMAHSPEKPDKPTVEKPAQDKPAEKPAPGTPDVNQPVPFQPTPPSRPKVTVITVVYPPPFRPLPIQTHLTHNGPPIVLQVEFGTPPVKSWDTCKRQGKPINCRVPEAKPVTVPAPKPPVAVKPAPKKRLVLPYGF